MFKKIIVITTIILLSALNANAGSDGELVLKKINHQMLKIALKL